MGLYIVLLIVVLIIAWRMCTYTFPQTDPFGRSCTNCRWITHPKYRELKKTHPDWRFTQLDVVLIDVDGRMTLPHLLRGPAENKSEEHLSYAVAEEGIIFTPRDAVDSIIQPWIDKGYVLVFPEP